MVLPPGTAVFYRFLRRNVGHKIRNVNRIVIIAGDRK